MIALQMDNVKPFMNKLLKDTVFDEFDVVTMDLHLGINIHIEGHLNMDYYSEVEREELLDQSYIRWADLKPTIRTLIMGNKTPLSMKIVLMVSKKGTRTLVDKSLLSFVPEDVNGFYLNLVYENNTLKLTTGTSFKLFTLDKSLEKYFDETITKFLVKHDLPFSIC